MKQLCASGGKRVLITIELALVNDFVQHQHSLSDQPGLALIMNCDSHVELALEDIQSYLLRTERNVSKEGSKERCGSGMVI